MSLDVYLELPKVKTNRSGIFIRENGQTKEISLEEWNEKFPGREPVIATQREGYVYHANITHNLVPMASEARVYAYLWRPSELNITHANQIITPLKEGLELLKSDRTRFEKLNPENGWGNYDVLVDFVEEYLSACEEYPEAKIKVWR